MTEPPGPQTLEADVAQVGTQGDGLVAGHYVAGVLPGERVRIRPVAPGRAHLASVLAPAPARVVPVCPHAGPCGGCTLQHADDRWMAAWKTERLVEALAAAGVVPGAVRPAEPGAP
ncbi:MAG: class I SAM-dependent RNA methyltransferase, partial [Pseudomonadota bacterium]